MPELPEVETVVREVRDKLVGRTIASFESRWPRQCSPAPDEIARKLRGQKIRSVTRRAKFIVLELDRGFLLIHLRMSGRLEPQAGATQNRARKEAVSELSARDDVKSVGKTTLTKDRPGGLGSRDQSHTGASQSSDEPSHVRAVWQFKDGGRMFFCDARKFGRIIWCKDLSEATEKLGIEPLSRAFTVAALARLLRSRARQLKPLLLDQSVVAGLGNIYTDEALFLAKLHPLMSSRDVSDEQIRVLRGAIQTVLKRGIQSRGATLDWVYPGGRMQRRFNVYGRDEKPCPRCNTPIEYLRVGQRGTHICPTCQPRSAKLRFATKLRGHTTKAPPRSPKLRFATKLGGHTTNPPPRSAKLRFAIPEHEKVPLSPLTPTRGRQARDQARTNAKRSLALPKSKRSFALRKAKRSFALRRAKRSLPNAKRSFALRKARRPA